MKVFFSEVAKPQSDDENENDNDEYQSGSEGEEKSPEKDIEGILKLVIKVSMYHWSNVGPKHTNRKNTSNN